jgi:hypothetical protein
MAVKELPHLVWRTFAEGRVALSEEGAVATHVTEDEHEYSLTTTGVELTEGKHYWEVEPLSEDCEVGALVGGQRHTSTNRQTGPAQRRESMSKIIDSQIQFCAWQLHN